LVNIGANFLMCFWSLVSYWYYASKDRKFHLTLN